MVLLACIAGLKKIRVSDYPFRFGYPRASVLGLNLYPNRSSVGFGFQVRVSILGAQILHPNRTRPVAILTPSFLPPPPPSLPPSPPVWAERRALQLLLPPSLKLCAARDSITDAPLLPRALRDAAAEAAGELAADARRPAGAAFALAVGGRGSTGGHGAALDGCAMGGRRSTGV